VHRRCGVAAARWPAKLKRPGQLTWAQLMTREKSFDDFSCSR
jgi:hypothetical protein